MSDRSERNSTDRFVRDLLRRVGRERELGYDTDTVAIQDLHVLERLSPPVQQWWVSTFAEHVSDNGGLFTPSQRQAIPAIDDGRNCLVASPTGSGKTLASFIAVLDDLFGRERDDTLESGVHCLYISPLKSLANDIERNLEAPLSGIHDELARDGHETAVTQAIRHGDTDDYARRQMLQHPPHVLNTTPETLAILLNSPKFSEHLRTVKYVIVDEIHSIAANKRGTHLSVSLERLEDLTADSPVRIGCSATVEPLDAVAEFLVGRHRVDGEVGDPEGLRSRPCEIVDTRFVREYDLELRAPAADLIHTPRSIITDRFYDDLHALIADHTNTLVFTNSRSGAERVLRDLRDRYEYDESNSGCHHGSLSEGQRTRVEEGLKSGDLDVVTTSTSLELGIDMPYLDLVVQVGSPKSVAALLQRVGRAGHTPGETVRGRVFALDRDELVECATMLTRAQSGFIDRVVIPQGAYDVAAQHVYGMAISRIRPDTEIRETLRRATPYHEFDDEAYERLMRYLTADYDGLTDRNVYPKVWRDRNDPPDGDHHHPNFPVGETLVGKRGRLARPIYLTNVGTIPDSFTCDVFTRDDEWVGTLDEAYLDTTGPGDVFALGGDRFAYRYRRGSKVYVDRTSERATVPSWYSERLPLSFDLGREILALQEHLLTTLSEGGLPSVRTWLRTLPIDENTVRAIARLFDEQVEYAGTDSVPTPSRLFVEEDLDRDAYKRRYYVHSTYGRRFNDGLSRILAAKCRELTDVTAAVGVTDTGFCLSVPLDRKVDLAGLVRNLDPDTIRSDLRSALQGTDLLKRYFRINAARSLMILKRYKGYEKSAAEQQVSAEMLLSFANELDEFAVMEETYRNLLEDTLDVGAIRTIIEHIQAGEIVVVSHTVASPSPLSFGLATLVDSDIVLVDDESAVLQGYHARVKGSIDDEST